MEYQLMDPLKGKYNLGKILRFVKVAKNRNGLDDLFIPYAFSGARGVIKEMPTPYQFSNNLEGCRNKIIDLFCE